MLTDVVVADYQSLPADIRIELGRLTVITGPTGSGKTSVFRALRTLVFNSRGTAYIRRGAKAAKVVLGSSDGDGMLGEPWAVGIERSTVRGRDCYRVAVGTAFDDPMGGPDAQVYTKLGGAVPHQVSALLALDEINFSTQFGTPFLLDETGSEAARVLGRLTGVTMVFEAARECARRRSRIAGDLKRVSAELDRTRADAQRFAGLRDRVRAAQAAEEHLARHQRLSASITSLTALLGQYGAAQAASRAIAVPVIPDTAAMDAAASRATVLRQLIAQHQQASGVAFDAAGRAQAQHELVHRATADLAAILKAAGICPTCGQPVQ